MDHEQIILVFASAHYVLAAEESLNSAPWSFQVIPLPLSVNEGCGLGILISSADEPAIQAYLTQHNILPVRAVAQK